jgi:hypothetical protein
VKRKVNPRRIWRIFAIDSGGQPYQIENRCQRWALQSNPAQIDGATRTRRASQSVVPDVDELTRIADLIEPARFKALILNSAWCCLRYDEVTE